MLTTVLAIQVKGILLQFLFYDDTQCNSGGFLETLFTKVLIQEVVFVFRHLSSALSEIIFYTKKRLLCKSHTDLN